MTNILRDQDVILSLNDLELLHQFRKFPVFMGTVDHDASQDLFSDMNWFISKNSGAIQLNPLLPLDVLYQEAHGSGCIGGLWMRHHKCFADFIRQYNPSSVLEIGGAHGILSKYYHEHVPDTRWTIIEPNPTPGLDIKARFIKGFFDDNFKLDEPVDAVIHSHVFEHVYDPKLFTEHISGFLPDGRLLIFSLPNMAEMLKRRYTNCINFEHTVLLTEPYIEFLLSQYGFRILEQKYFLEDHSIFYACIRDKTVTPSQLPDGLYELNKATYLNYVSYHDELIKQINSKIHNIGADQKLYLFGAHVFAQYLIAFGLDVNRIECILDNDPNKQGKRLYGTSLYVAPPKVIQHDVNPVVILKAGVYNQEIQNQIISEVNPNTIFLE